MELRPLGFGEIFDRAITLYVRNFVPFAAIVSVMVVPQAVLQYFLDKSASPQLDQMIRILEHPRGAAPTPVTPAFFPSPSIAWLYAAVVVVFWLIWPFALNACAVGIARLYRERPVEFGACYRASLGRWPSVLGLLALEAAIFVAWYAAFLVITVAMTVFATLVARESTAAGVVVGIFAVLVVLGSLFALAPLFVSLTFAMNAIVIEERGVFASLGLGFARVFNRHEIWRALLFALAIGAVWLAAALLIEVVAFVAIAHRWYVFEALISALFNAAVTPLSIVLLAVYYFDVRIRREGFDLEAGLDRLAGAAPVA